MTELGVDLSQNQVVTDYTALNAAIDFAYLRVLRSNGQEDESWRTFYNGIKKPKAPYIFLRPPATQTFVNQMKAFWALAGGHTWQWGPVIDAEYAGITGAQIRSAVAACRSVTGHRVVYVYVGYGDLRAGAAAQPDTFVTDDDVRVIGARYFANDKANAFTHFGLNFAQLDIVQYWDKGTVPGIRGVVDLNVARDRKTIPATPIQTPKVDDMLSTDPVKWTSVVDGTVHTENDMGDALAAALAMRELWTKGFGGVTSAGPGYLAITRIIANQATEQASVDALATLLSTQSGGGTGGVGLTVDQIKAAVASALADQAHVIDAALNSAAGITAP